MIIRSHTRRAGMMVPLFSIPSSRSWGIGEIDDLDSVMEWMARGGQRLLQVLPITETLTDDPSPYGALSAMAIDPQYVSLASVEDFAASGGEAALTPDQRATLDRVRSAPTVDYRAVRALKQDALRRSFSHFLSREWTSTSTRADAFRTFLSEQAWWLDDYALFRALHAHQGERAWTTWPEPLRARDPSALAAQREALWEEILFRQYLQWVAGEQWAGVRRRRGQVELFGDLPFIVSANSADVWARQDEFDHEGSVGVPPDAFSATGQDWGLPPYRWDVVEQSGFEWLRLRATRMASLFDGCRVDHLVGFYRTFVRPKAGGEGQFIPAEESEQVALGERVLGVLQSAGMEIVAEDLGTVPDFVRESLTRLSIPGYKVLRWERDWQSPGQPFRDPADYPEVALATSGTHDTEPLTVWWSDAAREERQAVLAIPFLRARLPEAVRAASLDAPGLPPEVHHALLEVLFASRAALLILPIQDLFGWSDRINQPGTIGDRNWTWRLPWPSDQMALEDQAISVAERVRIWSETYDR